MIKDISSITNITIETSTLCNARCVICPNNTVVRDLYITPLDDFKRNIQAFSCLKEISLCGMYEPLTDKRLPEIFNIIKNVNPNIKITMFTNGSLLHKWDNLLLENLSSIIFSVHAFRKDTYNNIMKGLDRDITYQNIINFCEKRKTSIPKTSVSFVRTSLNINELSDFITFWKQYVDNVTNYELMNWNGTVHNYKNLLDKPKTKVRECPMFDQPLVIDAYGNIVRCCYNFKFNYGNVRKDGINKWLSKTKTTNIYPDTDCFKCDGWRI